MRKLLWLGLFIVFAVAILFALPETRSYMTSITGSVGSAAGGWIGDTTTWLLANPMILNVVLVIGFALVFVLGYKVHARKVGIEQWMARHGMKQMSEYAAPGSPMIPIQAPPATPPAQTIPLKKEEPA